MVALDIGVKHENVWLITRIEQHIRLGNQSMEKKVGNKHKQRLHKKFQLNKNLELYLGMNMNRKEVSILVTFRLDILHIQAEVHIGRQVRTINRKCPFCRNAAEDEIHFFFYCTVDNEGREVLS